MSSQVLTQTRKAKKNSQSEIHQLLGDAKIQEISEYLNDKGKDTVNGVLSLFSVEDFMKTDKLIVRNVISQKAEEIGVFQGNQKEGIEEVLDVIRYLLSTRSVSVYETVRQEQGRM
ncbi:MAG: hypothetical protein WC475_02100 [Candidatus Paceibacterota bacterium]